MRRRSIALRVVGAAVVLTVAPAALVLAPAATAAYAHDSVTVTVSPASAGIGDEVEIRVRGCEAATGAAKTRAFAAGAQLYPRSGGGGAQGKGGELVARAEVKPGASGSYPVIIICDGHGHSTNGVIRVPGGSGDSTVSQGRGAGAGSSAGSSGWGSGAAPTAPVRAGGGGTAALAAGHGDGADSAGPGTPHTVIGLVLAGVAAVAVAFRSARRRRRTGTD
ncbi:hypothetical protein ACWF94_33670 [Streptomyces sp. NPDC055078]